MGIRGNVYRQLQLNRGYYIEAEQPQIKYVDSTDLAIKAYFKEERDAVDFFNAFMYWQEKMELLALSFVVVEKPREHLLNVDDRLELFTETMYDAKASGSPCTGLHQVLSSLSSSV